MSLPAKIVAGRLYVHVDQLDRLAPEQRARVERAERFAGLERGRDYTLARLDQEGPSVALLHYPDFAEAAFPALRESWLVDLERETLAYRTYAESLNPPILHRQELLLAPEHPRRAQCEALTAACESLGLFDETTRIGYRRQWLALVRERGYRIEGFELLPLGNLEEGAPETSEEETPLWGHWAAARQRTALARSNFSAPVQCLARHGFLDGQWRLFDYGCGRGDDVRGLRENGLEASGWDPYFAPDDPVQSAEIVNLGFVINVIEDRAERLEALTRAWSLAERLLVVSVMLANPQDPRGEPFRDGVMTQRGTFQKYFSSTEIRVFLQQALDEMPIPVAPGVLYVFRDKEAEQRFLLARTRRRTRTLSPLRPRAPAEPSARRDRLAERIAACREPLDRLWATWLSLGRPPEASEVEELERLRETFGSLPKALRILAEEHDPEELERARAARRDDLAVYFALLQFERRRPYSHLDAGLQRDIRAFFGDYASAQAEARARLFQIADTEALASACDWAAARGLGWLEPGQSLQLHLSLVERLPPLLRLYVGAGLILHGEESAADLVKIHLHSGKLSLMRYDDFVGQPLPRLIERTKLRLREQDWEDFLYGEEHEPPYLFHKSRYINEEFPHYPEQLAFEEALDALALFDFSGYGPPPRRFRETLARERWAIDGFRLVRSGVIPDLDDPCGRYLRFRDLIECGETQAVTGLENRPRQSTSYDALQDLARLVLDPLIDYFGMIRLTYGFCSPELARLIPGRIDPKRDQHAAHELNRLGNPICARLGAAVDLLVEDENMLEVAQWVVRETPFDRLYFYGVNQPIHVSHGPNHDRQVVWMRPGPSGRLVPRVMGVEDFLNLSLDDG
ncbi:MAG: DNA phosphorothioation-associated putative methyltransferase [Chromatiaceae bacterium]|nr:DNA phosphorothioation-associated putative methyltransferase [Chromatiaceae bacterium]